MIITIDGPAGAGKSTAARELARRLRFEFLDTGAMYRAVTLAVLQRELDPSDAAACEKLASTLNLQLDAARVFLDGHDCTAALRRPEVTRASRFIAAHAGIRQRLAQLQRQIARGRHLVTEGRDQGTVVFPHAECKFFLEADPRERARRRQIDLQRRGQSADLEIVLADQEDRDRRDRDRAVGPLVAAADALRVDTTRLTAEEVVDLLERHVRNRASDKLTDGLRHVD